MNFRFSTIMKRARNSERKRNLVSVPKPGVSEECDSNPEEKLPQEDFKSKVYKNNIFIINMTKSNFFVKFHSFFLEVTRCKFGGGYCRESKLQND